MTDSAIAQRAQNVSDAVRSMTINEDMEKTQKERVNMFYEFVKVGTQTTWAINSDSVEKSNDK